MVMYRKFMSTYRSQVYMSKISNKTGKNAGKEDKVFNRD